MSRFTGTKVADEAFIPIMSLIIALCGAALVPPPLRPRPLDLTRIKGSGEKISQRGGAAAQASTRHRWHTARLEARSRSRSAGRGEQPTPTPLPPTPLLPPPATDSPSKQRQSQLPSREPLANAAIPSFLLTCLHLLRLTQE